jgi:hypothetical protein
VFPEAIKRAIEQSDAFVFVITPDAVRSVYCENEVDYARQMQKRIVPLLREPVPDSELPAEIRDRNWIPFTEEEDFDPGVARVVTALDVDLEAAKAHTRWLVKALDWDWERRDKSFLLRGAELSAAEAWLASSPDDADPAPTPIQREYVLASRTAAARRQRMLMVASAAVAAVSIGLLIFALISRGQAVTERVAARSQALAAESQAHPAGHSRWGSRRRTARTDARSRRPCATALFVCSTRQPAGWSEACMSDVWRPRSCTRRTAPRWRLAPGQQSPSSTRTAARSSGGCASVPLVRMVPGRCWPWRSARTGGCSPPPLRRV